MLSSDLQSLSELQELLREPPLYVCVVGLGVGDRSTVLHQVRWNQRGMDEWGKYSSRDAVGDEDQRFRCP